MGRDSIVATWYVFSVWLHILAAATWIGGMIFFAAVVVPIVRRTDLGDRTGLLMHRMGLRFRTVGWLALSVLVGTGLINLGYRGVDWSDAVDPAFWSNGFGHTLGIKLLVVLAVLALSAVHDFYVGPRATAQLRQAPGSERAQKLRRAASRFGRVNLLLGLIAMALGVMLVRGLPG
jgi:uncharacterized membrane protein